MVVEPRGTAHARGRDAGAAASFPSWRVVRARGSQGSGAGRETAAGSGVRLASPSSPPPPFPAPARSRTLRLEHCVGAGRQACWWEAGRGGTGLRWDCTSVCTGICAPAASRLVEHDPGSGFKMQQRRGRTGRVRWRRRSSDSRGVNESHRPEFIELRRWLKGRKFEDTGLVPACFPGTGRGLMSKTALQEGQMIISLPESCLLTTNTVIRSSLGPYMKKWKPPPSPLLALCTFLISERHAGRQSLWKSYLDILPKSYTCPVCLEPDVVDLLPQPLKAKAEEQRADVQDFFASSRAFFSTLQPLFVEPVDGIFSYSAFLWAWCTVNTRAVYLRSTRQECLSAEPDTCALAPYLDLLNHSPHVQVKAAFNEKTGCYEIRTASRCRKHEQVFICYGPYDNQRLLLEYGFVSVCNPHACVPVPGETLVKYLPAADKQAHKKMSILKDRGFTENLTFGWDGPSWRLFTALKLLCLEAEKFMSWKKVLLGEVISDTNEKTSLGMAQRICSDFIEETQAVLRKVSDLKEGKTLPTHQLSLVEALRMEELRILQASAEIVSSSRARCP